MIYVYAYVYVYVDVNVYIYIHVYHVRIYTYDLYYLSQINILFMIHCAIFLHTHAIYITHTLLVPY